VKAWLAALACCIEVNDRHRAEIDCMRRIILKFSGFPDSLSMSGTRAWVDIASGLEVKQQEGVEHA